MDAGRWRALAEAFGSPAGRRKAYWRASNGGDAPGGRITGAGTSAGLYVRQVRRQPGAASGPREWPVARPSSGRWRRSTRRCANVACMPPAAMRVWRITQFTHGFPVSGTPRRRAWRALVDEIRLRTRPFRDLGRGVRGHPASALLAATSEVAARCGLAVDVVAYVRPQCQYLESIYAERVKLG